MLQSRTFMNMYSSINWGCLASKLYLSNNRAPIEESIKTVKKCSAIFLYMWESNYKEFPIFFCRFLCQQNKLQTSRISSNLFFLFLEGQSNVFEVFRNCKEVEKLCSLSIDIICSGTIKPKIVPLRIFLTFGVELDSHSLINSYFFVAF